MRKILAFAVIAILLAGCNASKNVNYMQDVKLNQPVKADEPRLIKVRPGDQISIVVTCKDPELARIFNNNYNMNQGSSGLGSIGSVTSTIGAQNAAGNNQSSLPYQVDEKGDIDFPVLGELHVAGLTRAEIASMIKRRIIEGNYIEDPRVNVTFINLHYTLLGEVNSPGVKNITDDKITIIDAIAQAGDLGIQGRRDRIFVTRTENGERTTYQVDMRTTDLYDSPVYYLQQDDVIYVEPNGVRAGQSTINENNFKSVSMWMSICSFLMSLSVFIFK